MTLNLNDIISISNNRYDAFQNLWNFYVVFVGAAFALAKIRFNTSQPRLFTYGIPVIFLVGGLTNLYGLLLVARQRDLLSTLAVKVSNGDPALRPLLETLSADTPIVIATGHLFADISMAVFLHFVAKSSSPMTE